MSSEAVGNTQTQGEPKLEFKRIDVSFIYGYVSYNREKKTGETDDSQEMWVPVYNLNRSEDGFFMQNLILNEKCSLQHSNGVIDNVKLSASISKKRGDGGAGSLTIKVSVEAPDEKNLLDIKSVFQIMNLIPRSSKTPALNSLNHKLERSEYLSTLIKDKKYSSIFELFCDQLLKNQECWCELIHCDKKCDNQFEIFPIYNYSDSKIDPQIPYMLIEGVMPENFYTENFMEKHVKQGFEYEIGCLLGRWINPDYSEHLNIDYYKYYKDNDGFIGEENAFISRYRDKKTYIVFSPLLTLLFKSEKNYNPDIDVPAAELTTNSVQNYLEFSRSRLHHSLWLNKQLDRLVCKVARQETTSKILESKHSLNKLKIQVAKSMNNPISYMWDSVLGQEIPALRINNNIDNLEKETIKKLNLISELISDKIQNSQIYDFIEDIKSK